MVEHETPSIWSFALGCVLSTVLGIGQFAPIYQKPLFLAFVQVHGQLMGRPDRTEIRFSGAGAG